MTDIEIIKAMERKHELNEKQGIIRKLPKKVLSLLA